MLSLIEVGMFELFVSSPTEVGTFGSFAFSDRGQPIEAWVSSPIEIDISGLAVLSD